MKTIILSEANGPESISVKDVETPEPGEGEARVKLKASALNRRDVWLTRGLYPRMQLPCTPGSDGAGIVEAVGKGVDKSLLDNEVVIYPVLEWGDDPRCFGPNFRILGMPDQGTFAEAICVPAENLYPRPAHLGWEQAAALPLAGLTAWRAGITQGGITEGQKVLVTGAGGGVAGIAVMLYSRMGAEVYVSSGSDEKIEIAVQSLGAVAGENYRNEDCYKNLKKQTGGFDVIVDSAGGKGLNSLLDALGPGGRYVFYGATLGDPDTGLSLGKLFFKQNRLQGTTMGTPAEFQAMLEFVDKNKIEPLIDKVYPLDEAMQAHTQMETQDHTGKIVLRNSGD